LYNNEGTAVSFQERPFEIALTTGRSTTTSATAAITSTDAIYFYQRKNKTRFPVAITVTAIILDKNIVGTIEVFRDITKEIELDNVKAEDQKKIEMAEAKDEATLASIGSGIIAGDEQGHVVAMSRMAEKMLGWQLKEIKGGDLHEIVPVTDESGNRVLKDKNGARQESADYHNVVVFGRQAETVAQYMKKGSSILVEGRMQTRSWDDKTSGEKKYRTEIVADRTQFGPKGGASSGAGTSSAGSKMPVAESQEVDAIEYPEEDINPEDIPF